MESCFLLCVNIVYLGGNYVGGVTLSLYSHRAS